MLIGEKVKDERVERWKSEKVKQGDNLSCKPVLGNRRSLFLRILYDFFNEVFLVIPAKAGIQVSFENIITFPK